MNFLALVRAMLGFAIAVLKRRFLLFTLTPWGKHLDNIHDRFLLLFCQFAIPLKTFFSKFKDCVFHKY